MTDKTNPPQDLDKAMLSLREEYEQTAAPIENQPEPKQGQELKGRRFPKIISYLMGSAAVMMLVAAIFLFNMQNGLSGDVPVVDGVVETAVDPETGQPIPTPPLLVAPPPPPAAAAIPLPPEPTPWPTPPIAPDSQS